MASFLKREFPKKSAPQRSGKAERFEDGKNR
jgi:hypothetical protein